MFKETLYKSPATAEAEYAESKFTSDQVAAATDPLASATKLNIEDVISSVAKFVNIPISRSLLSLTKENSSHSFMKKNEEKFDEHRTQQALNLKCGLPEGGNSSKVNSRLAGMPLLTLTNQIEDNLALFWEKEIFNKLGFRTYSDFRKNVT